MALAVSTDIPAGNAVVLEVRCDADPPQVHFTPSPRGGPEAIWFHFAITPDDAKAPREIHCVMHLVDCLLGGSDASVGFAPVFKTSKRDWTRVDAVETQSLDDGRPTATWRVPGNEGPVQVALCYPYAQAELDALTQAITPAFQSNVIGVTQQERPLHRLSNDPGRSDEAKRPGIYCVARQHAAETPGSWMLDGFLRAMAESEAAAPLVWAVPFADLDGVIEGRAGKDSFPWDFNRAWGSKLFPRENFPTTGSHPMRYEVRCIQNDMRRWRDRCQPQLVLDFHAPVMCRHDGIFCYLSSLDASGQPGPQHQPWINAFRKAVGDELASERFAQSGQYPSRWMTARIADFASQAMGVPDITFEVPYACTPHHQLTRESYQGAGRRIALAIIDTLAK